MAQAYGLRNFRGGGHEFARLAPSAREPRGKSGGMLPRKILKNSLFNAISCVLASVFMHGASNKWKENIKNISETKPEQEDCPTLK